MVTRVRSTAGVRGTVRRPARRDFARLVAETPPQEQRLPLTHVTDGYALREVMERGELGTTHCPVMDEALLYLFYGRPAYRSADAEPSALAANWPVCFLLRPAGVSPKRIHPFDTGAFEAGRFQALFDRRMLREDFELDVDPTTPGRLIGRFWRNEQAYFDAKGASDFEPDPFAFEAAAYGALTRHAAAGTFDERATAIELQSDAALPLAGNVMAVVLPYEFMRGDVVRAIEAAGGVALAFDVVARHTPRELVGQIYQIVRDFVFGGRGGRAA